MSDILIHGMEMPKKQVCVILNPNGLVEVLDANNVLLEEYQAVPVPPHGRLGDLDALYEDINKSKLLKDEFKKIILSWLNDQATIIPAEKE